MKRGNNMNAYDECKDSKCYYAAISFELAVCFAK